MRYREVRVAAPRIDWTDARVERLKTLLAKGLSAAQIAIAFNTPSRNAIIGKVHRMGLQFKRKPTQQGSPSQRVTRKHVERKGPFRPKSAPRPAAVAPKLPAEEPTPVHVDDLLILEKQRRTVLTLRANECRWPVGDPKFEPDKFFFCGDVRAEGSPYCPHHDRRSKP